MHKLSLDIFIIKECHSVEISSLISSQDPSMSNVLESFTNPSNKDQLEERMARIKEDPSLKPILEEIETGGPAAMMRLEIFRYHCIKL